MIYLYKKLKMNDKTSTKNRIYLKPGENFVQKNIESKKEAELEILQKIFLYIQLLQNDLYVMCTVYNQNNIEKILKKSTLMSQIWIQKFQK